MYLRLLTLIAIVNEAHQVLSQQDAVVKEINTCRKNRLTCEVCTLEVDWDLSQRTQMLARSLAKDRCPLDASSVPIDSDKEKLVYGVGKNELESPAVIIDSENEKILEMMEYDRVGYSRARGCNGNAIVMIFRLNEKAFQDYFTMILKSHRAVLEVDNLPLSSSDELDTEANQIAKSSVKRNQNSHTMELADKENLTEIVKRHTTISLNKKGQLQVRTVCKWKGSKYDLMKETIECLLEDSRILEKEINGVGFGYAANDDLACTVVLLSYDSLNTSKPVATTTAASAKATAGKNTNSWPKYSKFTFFFGKVSPFSQMHSLVPKKDQLFMTPFMRLQNNKDKRQPEAVPDKFFEEDRKFPTCEHWMMAHKAIAFYSYDLAVRMLEEKDPVNVKKLGRSIEGFKDSIWDIYKVDVVKTCNFFKFGKNQELFHKLKATKNTELVEVNPDDTIWGIGLRRSHPSILLPEKWEGMNLLGHILTEVRDELPDKFDANYQP